MNVFNQISGRENSSKAVLRLLGVWTKFDNGCATIGRPIVVGMDTHRRPMSWCSSIMQMTPSVERRKGSVLVCCAGSLLSLFASHVHGDGRIWWAGLFLLHRSLFKNLSIGGRALATGRDKHTPTRKGCRYFLQFVGALVFIFGWRGVEDAPKKTNIKYWRTR